MKEEITATLAPVVEVQESEVTPLDLYRHIDRQYPYIKAAPILLGLLALTDPAAKEHLLKMADDLLSPSGIEELEHEEEDHWIPLLRQCVSNVASGTGKAAV